MNSSKFALAGSAALITAMLLTACGGGGSTSSPTGNTPAPTPTPTAGSAVVAGTVTGFGSVIVDGVRIDDKNVTAGVVSEDGSVQKVELKIGQHVEVKHDGNLVATEVRVRSELEGPVTAVDTVAGTLTVLSQAVAINTDATLGPVTVFEAPYTQLSDVAVNDKVEIHGVIKIDKTTNKTTVQATRVEKKVLPTYFRTKGKVTNLNTTDKTFKIGDLLINYTSATIKPTGAVLAEGAVVYVSIPVPETFTATAANAGVILVDDKKTETRNTDVNVGGAITKWDSVAKTFVIDSVTIDASTATFDQPGKSFSDLSEGLYVRVKGTYQTDGTIKAKSLVLPNDDRNAQVELHGNILSFVSNANFVVRDLNIDASTATITCNNISLANNLAVEVKGVLTATGKITAKSVKCETEVADTRTIERKGVASQADATAKTVVVGTGNEAINVVWTDTTLFVGVDAATLNDKVIIIQGTISDITDRTKRVFHAQKIKLAPLAQ